MRLVRSPTSVLRCVVGLLSLVGIAACAASSGPSPVPAPPLVAARAPAGEIVRLTPADAAREADSIQRVVRAEAAPGLEVSLWASKAMIVDPTAIAIDDQGAVYAIQTQRDGSTMDIRQNRDWYVPSLAMRTVEERQQFYRRELAPERSERNTARVQDLNKDGSHDWRDLTVKTERVWRIMDTDGDGRADFSQNIVEGFNTDVGEPAQGLQVVNGELFVAAAPNLWRLRDTDGDGLIDARDSISHGYHVKVGYGGHSFNGVVQGPDGRVYFSVGDIGMSVTDQQGRRWDYPDRGSIMRMNPDGSDFEVFATGLRNPYDFAFDDYGNLITADNDGDNDGESERIVYVTSGQDSGWRINWQFGKYTDPANNTYKPWMDEGIHLPDREGQAAWFTPPVALWSSGPAGMVYNPGTALSERWRNHFFVASSAGSVNAFALSARGAGFEVVQDTALMTVSGFPTGLEFGPDGALYVADWIATFNPKGDGRIWKVDAPGSASTPLRAETRALLASRFEPRSAQDLRALLGHADQRVRVKAQFELARRGDMGTLLAAARQRESQLARVHALWGIAQVARRDARQGGQLRSFLRDADAEIRAQAAKQLGDVRHAASAADLLPLLKDDSPRVRFFAAEALGRLAYGPAVQPLIEMLVENDDRDDYLRQAGVTALERIGQVEPLVALARHPSRAARVAAVVALRRLRDARIAIFLSDQDEYVVTEAAMAINDDGGIAGATAALAQTLDQGRFRGQKLLRRALNANLLTGTPEAARRVAAFAARQDVADSMRVEAIAILGVWSNPSVLDRVDGVYRGVQPPRDGAQTRAAVLPLVEPLFASGSVAVRVALAQALGRLDAEAAAPALLARVRQDEAAEVRVAAFEALQVIATAEVMEAVQTAVADPSPTVRSAAMRILPTLQLPEASTAQLLAKVVESGSAGEQQTAISALGQMRGAEAQQVLGALMDRLETGMIAPAAELDLEEAVQASGAVALQARLQRHQATRSASGVLASYHSSLNGGDAAQGNAVVLRSTSACTQCHSLTDGGSSVGPNLRGIGARLTREQILEALVDPSARLAPGYGMVTLTLTNGQSLAGKLVEETDTYLMVEPGQGQPRRVAVSEIARRVNAPSTMPPMHLILSRREIRDVVEFLTRYTGQGGGRGGAGGGGRPPAGGGGAGGGEEP